MKTEIKIGYEWLDEDLKEPSKEIAAQLDESAERQINEQISKGFTSGEFSEEVFEKKYWCHWSRNTARVDENQPTPQMISDFEEKYSQKPKEEKPVVQFYQLGANLNLNHEVKIAHYPNGFEKKIESDAYRLFIGVGKEGLIEMLMSGETFKALLKNEPIDAISLEDFKKNYL